MEEFLIGTGLVLFMALLAWSDKIKNWHKETREIEMHFCETRDIKWDQIRALIRNDTSANKKLDALNKLISSESLKEKRDINIIGSLINLDDLRNKLISRYKIKYVVVIILTFIYFVSGIINLVIDDTKKIEILKFQFLADYTCVFICIVISLGSLIYVICLNSLEGRYRNEFMHIEEKI